MNEYKERIKYACLLSLKKSPQKFYITMKVRFFKRDKDGHKIEESAFFHGSMYTLLRKEDFEDSFHSSVKKIMNAFDIFTRNGSGWILDRVENISLNSYHYEPVSASSYIPTPKAIKGKRAIINVQNVNDKKCFEYSVLATLYHHEIDKTNATKPSLYKKYLGEVLKGCKEAMRIDDIPQFENRNNISIAVYRINKGNGKTVYPLYMTKRRDKDPINLLLIEGENYHHYTWIKHFNRLLKSPKQKKTKLFCPYCCYGFRKDKNGRSNLDELKMFCQPNGVQSTKFLPKGKNYIEFKDFEKMQEAPYVIYADFECINEKSQNCVKAAIAFVCKTCKRRLLSALLQLITFVCLLQLNTFKALLQFSTFVCHIEISSILMEQQLLFGLLQLRTITCCRPALTMSVTLITTTHINS